MIYVAKALRDPLSRPAPYATSASAYIGAMHSMETRRHAVAWGGRAITDAFHHGEICFDKAAKSRIRGHGYLVLCIRADCVACSSLDCSDGQWPKCVPRPSGSGQSSRLLWGETETFEQAKAAAAQALAKHLAPPPHQAHLDHGECLSKPRRRGKSGGSDGRSCDRQ
jgi:hypothetical protein